MAPPPSSLSARAATPPPSPFFKPSFPAEVLQERDVATPKGRHHRLRKVKLTENVTVEKKSGVIGCCANLTTCIVGSGIVGLPYAMKSTGFVAGIVLIVLTAALTEKSLRLIIETAKHVHKQSYETLAEVAFGVVGFRFILINMFIMAYGAMVTYLMITKTCASLLLGVEDATYQQYTLLVISLIIQFPLAAMRDMADLEKTSGLAVAIDLSIVALVAYSSPWTEMKGVEQTNVFQLMETDIVHSSTLFVGLGVLSFAFECQEAAFLVAGSLHKPTVKRWGKVTSMTLTACLCLALVCALTGYLGFGDETKGNILENLDPTTKTSFAAHGMLGATMFATYPLASFVARHVCIVLLFEGHQAHEGGDDSSILNRPDRRILLTLVLYIAAMIPATIYTDMGKVLALAGVIGGSCLAYIGPGLLYLAVHGGRFLELTNTFFFVSDVRNGNEVGVTSETTALVRQPEGGQNEELPKSEVLDGCLKACLFYLGGMPLWRFIAHKGAERVIAHASNLAAKNIVEDLRIGEVDHQGIEKLVQNGNSHDTKNPVPVNKFAPQVLSNLIRPRSSGDVLGNQVTEKSLPKPKQQLAPSLEPDPQEMPPAWRDYFIAIFYVCFGCVALFAGLFSLFDESDEDVTVEQMKPRF